MPSMKVAIAFLALAGALLLVTRSAPADPIGIVVDNNTDGLMVTVNAEGANVHFGYSEDCGGGKPCYSIDAGQGMVGITGSAPSCEVKGGGPQLTGIQCPTTGVGSITFKMMNGGSWSAYQGGGGEHAGTPCSPARVIVITGAGATSVNAWDGCHEVVQCNDVKGAFSGVEVDASDDVHGKCSSVVKH